MVVAMTRCPFASTPSGSPPGYSLLEVAAALGVLAVVMAGLAPLFVQVSQTTERAASQTSAHVLAVAKAEALRSIWATSDVAPPTSPDDSLDEDVAGWVEWLDADGRAWPIAGISSRFVRRWAARPVSPGAEAYAVVVVVMPVTSSGRRADRPRQPGDGWAAVVVRRAS